MSIEEVLLRVTGRGSSYIESNEGRLTGLVTRSIGTHVNKILLKKR
jgi:hypothetical protein